MKTFNITFSCNLDIDAIDESDAWLKLADIANAINKNPNLTKDSFPVFKIIELEEDKEDSDN